MAWQLRTTCQQCSRKLNATDRKAGTVCTPCVKKNAGTVWGNDRDDDYEEDGNE